MASTEHGEHLSRTSAEPDMRPLKMVRQILSLAVLSAVLLAAGSCRSRTDRTAGPVILTFGTITEIPTVVSVSSADSAGGVFIGTFTLQSIVKDPSATINPGIEDLEVTSYQV